MRKNTNSNTAYLRNATLRRVIENYQKWETI